MTLFVATFSTLLAIINTLETLPVFGTGEIATVLGMTSLVKHAEFEVAALVAISVALLAAMLVTYMVLRVARIVLARIGPQGIHAAMGMIFHGVIEALPTYGRATMRTLTSHFTTS